VKRGNAEAEKRRSKRWNSYYESGGDVGEFRVVRFCFVFFFFVFCWCFWVYVWVWLDSVWERRNLGLFIP